jgi:transcriptional regulator with XRE-family HTH domain
MRKELTPGEIVGQNLGDLRRSLGLTQVDVARAMVALGFPWQSRQTVAEVEAGHRAVSWDEFFALAAFFEMPPTALLISPGFQAPFSHVKLVGRAITWQDWSAWWEWDTRREGDSGGPLDRPAPGPVKRAIDHVLYGRGFRRPWAARWRKGGPVSTAYSAARDEILARRERPAGPTFVAEETTDLQITVPPWINVKITLEAGMPYAARDEAEAEALRHFERNGTVRRVERHKARALRQRGKR